MFVKRLTLWQPSGSFRFIHIYSLHKERQGVEFYFDGKDLRILLSIRSFNPYPANVENTVSS